MEMQRGGSLAGWARLARVCAMVLGVLAAAQTWSQVAVTDGGQAAYSIPITAPPGIAGLEPKFALQYTRGSGGPFGEGWSLGGLSVITRCGSTQATDGVRKGVRYTSEDRFCLDGQRLIATNADGNPVPQSAYSGGAGMEFRTEKDSYSRVRAYGGSGSTGPDYFRVWTKSGLVYDYGTEADSRITTVKAGAATQVAMAWAVSRIADTSGNFMSVSYLNEINGFVGMAGREWMVHQVRYTGRGIEQPPNRVEFVYEDRPDKSEAFHEGAKSVTTKRLARVSTFINTTSGDREVTRYKLQYTVSPNTGKSLVQSVQQCSGVTTTKCLPATSFAYSPGPGPVFARKPLANLNLSRKDNTKGYTRGTYQGDFNGDGKQDILVWDDDPAQNHLWLSNGDGTFNGVGQPLPGTPQIGHSNGCYHVSVADFNADSIADVLHIQDPDAKPTCSGVERKSQIFLGTTGGAFQNPVALTSGTGTALSLMRIDPTRVCTESPSGADWQCPANSYVSYGGRNYVVSDINGDGLPDILFTRTPPHANDTRPTMCAAAELSCLYLGTTTVGAFTKVTTSLAQADLYSPSGWQAAANLPSTYQKDRLFVGDLNGDGLADIFVRDTGMLYLADGPQGAFTARQAAPGCTTGAEILDINGDGKWDVACMDFISTNPYTVHVNEGEGTFSFRSNVSNWAGVACKDGMGLDAQPSTCDPMYRSFINYLAADLDGDGISDIAAIGGAWYAGGGKPNSFLKGQRNGSFAAYSIPTLESEPLMSGRQALVGDFTGRGTVEFLRYSDNAADYALFVRDDSQPADLLRTVTTAGNARTEIKYRPMTDAFVYSRGTGAQLPIVDVVSSQWLVSAIDMPNGRGDVITTTYQYGAQRADLSGRGLLGFRTIKKTAPAPNPTGTLISTLTTNRQDFPFNGLPQETRRYVTSSGPNTFLSLATSEYVLTCPTSGSPAIYRPALASTTEDNRDLGGYAISYVQTVNSGYTCYGDPLTVTINTRRDAAATEVYSRVTTNEYTQNTSGDTWILGRLISATQTNTVPVVAFTGASVSTSPTVTVTVTPMPMVAGQRAARTWTASNATALSYACTSAAGGYTESKSVPVSGSDFLEPQASWVTSPSICTWTVSGPQGTRSVTQELQTVSSPSQPTPAPTITVSLSPNPLVAGQSFQLTWSTTGANSVSYSCGASGTGFKGSSTLAASGTDSAIALAEWVNYPSTCLWTASGTGGTTTTTIVMNTTAAPATVPAPTITVDMQTNLNVNETYPIVIQTTYASQVNVSCVSGGVTKTGSQPTNDTFYFVPDDTWASSSGTVTWACTWTATGAGGTATTSKTLYIQRNFGGSGG